MKSQDLQNTALSKYPKGDIPTEIHCHLNSGIGLATIKSWCLIIPQSATKYTCRFMDSQDTKTNIQRVQNHLHRKQKVLARKLLQQVFNKD